MGTTLDDAALRSRVEDWCGTKLGDVLVKLKNAASLCEQNGLTGDAENLRQADADLVRQWTDIHFHDLARNATPEEIAAWQQRFGRFPMPTDDVTRGTQIQRDRWAALFGHIGLLAKMAGRLLQSVEAYADTEQDAAAGTKRPGRKPPGRKKADYATEQNEAKLAADWERAHENSVYKADFAKGKGMKPSEFQRLLNRVRQRKRRTDK